ncbi:cell division cycle protein 45 [Heterostelium album PN500]|uniref:Cell division cycle protein 45 n=1 Tax=Heterostelium pallidum (strain ATCC 26659 / Pp 5 / PN500) TaxID=670386 RepID=D3BKP9_HETP5|nr:cell division cycle protein 45 [Heterostelium album PN500]EFA78479.1 cell division cycle protein 45 [Heterostelium album PN500]|eukprot:XP_020430603.1 cell division cycle protein 45 [Heterostelium album PN500]
MGAVKCKSLEVIRYIESLYPERYNWVYLFHASLAAGAIEITKYILEKNRLGTLTFSVGMIKSNFNEMFYLCLNAGVALQLGTHDDLLDAVVGKCSLEVVQYLSPKISVSSPAVMDLAAADGNLAIVQWLHQNRTEGCTNKSIQEAVVRGHKENRNSYEMVLTNPTRFNDIYELLKSDSIQGETVLLLVARDCDSLAACKIFSPVSGLTDLEYVNEHMLVENEELKTIVMINCGGNIDIESVFTNLNTNQLVYIIDSHRPYNRNNIENQTNAIIIDDGTYEEEEEEEDGDGDEDDNDGDDEEDIYDENDDDIYDDDEAEEVGADEEDEDDGEKEDDDYDGENVYNSDEDNDEQVFGGAKDKRKNNSDEDNDNERPSMKKKKKNTPKKNKKKTNSNNSNNGNCASTMMYHLSTVLMKESLDGILWYSLLGLTDQLVHERVSLEDYGMEYKYFKSLVANNYPSDEEVANGRATVQGDRVVHSEDYRFMLYRHWNLYDSLYHSKYVACNLRAWKAKGRYLLETLFALMGLPLDQAKQKYISMSAPYKTSLKRQLSIHAPKFGLDKLYFPSFSKKYECSIELSASDMIYALTALLESDNLEDDISDSEAWEQNFWEAYDALSNKNIELLMEGLKQAIVLQKEITRRVASMIEKRIVVLSGPFRYALLTETSDIKYFIHPMALTKLGLFMIDALTAMKKQPKPFLIGALNEKKGNYLIVGISGSLSTEQQANEFGVNFRAAAEMTNSPLKYQSFDTAVVEIGKLDMPKFIEQLHTMSSPNDDQDDI